MTLSSVPKSTIQSTLNNQASQLQLSVSGHTYQSPALTQSQSLTSKRNYNSPQNRHNNLVIFGIPEPPKGTPFQTRKQIDYDSVINALNATPNQISSLNTGTQWCRRIGKYKPPTSNTNTPKRPLRVCFNNSAIISQILLNSSSLPTGISIQKDMSKQERLCHSALLKERYRLVMTEGIDKDLIKIKSSKLYINSRLHGEYIQGSFVASK